MQSILEHHLPPCLSHITVEYMSGTRQHWADIFTSTVLPQLDACLEAIKLTGQLRVWPDKLRNVHDRKKLLMSEIHGRTHRFRIPSCRKF